MNQTNTNTQQTTQEHQAQHIKNIIKGNKYYSLVIDNVFHVTPLNKITCVGDLKKVILVHNDINEYSQEKINKICFEFSRYIKEA